MSVLAHGVGSRTDLPLPVSFVVVGGGLALVASFVALGLLWRSPRLTGARAGRPVPGWLQAFADSAVTTGVLRLVVLALSAFVLLVAWVGPESATYNLAPWVLYVTFWVGLVPLSLLFGPVWARCNPLRTVHGALERLMGPAPFEHVLPRLGYYPAAVSVLAFAWLELAAPDRSAPHRVAIFLTGYATVQLFAAACFGAGWFARGDAFEVYSRLLGRLAVLGRRGDGRLVWRSPLNGIAGLDPVAGLWAVVVALVGTTAFDGLTRTTQWQSSQVAEQGAVGSTLGLLVTVALVAVLFLGGSAIAGQVAGRPDAADLYAPSIVPIAAGYAIAHYFSLFLLDGQTAWRLVSDPFHTGRDLFGTADLEINYTLVSPRLISLVQVFAIVGAHIIGLLLAHDRALVLDVEGSRPHRPWVAQLPLLVVMVALTSSGLLLLLGT